MDDKEYSYLIGKLSILTSIDLAQYNGQQMRRRLEGYLSKCGAPNAVAYCRTVEEDKEKLKDLLNFLTINVSEFFRDLPQYRHLKTVILPQLLKVVPKVNIWSSACSRGQEPYSIAMILEQLCPGHNHRILATDIDDGALQWAKDGGPYPQAEVKNVDDHTLRRFFEKRDKGYWVVDRIKEKVQFGRHNLLSDTAERGFDIVLCRNVVIYFTGKVRDRLHQKFWGSLKKDGVLFLGGSEVILRPREMGFANMFSSFYRKVPVIVEANAPVKV